MNIRDILSWLASFFLRLAFIALLLMGSAVPMRGQSVLDTIDPNANGTVRVVLGSDGSLQIWDLKTLRSSLAHLGLDWEMP